MSKIEELINKKCPDGVEYKTLEQLEDSGIITLGRGKVISKKDIQDNPGDYPIYSSSAVGSGIFGTYGDYMFDDVRLSWSIDGGGKFFYRDAPKYSVTNVCGWLTVDKPEMMDIRYLYFALTNEWSKKVFDYVHKAHPSVIRKEYTIPVPPLEVQREIVGMLNSFTELEAELEAELTKRRQQYEHYREILLGLNTKNGDIVKLKSVATYSKERIPASELDEDSFVGVDNLLQNKVGKTISEHIPEKGNCTRYNPGDTLIGNIRPYLKKIWFSDNVGGASGDVLVISNKSERLDNRYLYHILASDNFFEYDNGKSKGSKMPRGDKASIMEYEFSIPPLSEQLRVVAILDKFDEMINDLSSGLPAEIDARHKQYEYYRDKLLTFKER